MTRRHYPGFSMENSSIFTFLVQFQFSRIRLLKIRAWGRVGVFGLLCDGALLWASLMVAGSITEEPGCGFNLVARHSLVTFHH